MPKRSKKRAARTSLEEKLRTLNSVRDAPPTDQEQVLSQALGQKENFLIARAIGDAGQRAGVSLLKFKTLVGDPEPEVLTECFTSIVHLGRERVMPFIRSYLVSNDPIMAESAALALGQVRLEGTEPALINALEQVELTARRSVPLLGPGHDASSRRD